MVHIVGFNQFALEVNLEHSLVESGTRRHWIVLVAKVIPFLPLVDEDAKVGRVLVQAEEKLVEVVACMGCIKVSDDIDAGSCLDLALADVDFKILLITMGCLRGNHYLIVD